MGKQNNNGLRDMIILILFFLAVIMILLWAGKMPAEELKKIKPIEISEEHLKTMSQDRRITYRIELETWDMTDTALIRKKRKEITLEEMGKDISAIRKEIAGIKIPYVKIDYVKIEAIALNILKFKSVSDEIFRLSIPEMEYMLIEYPQVKGLVVRYFKADVLKIVSLPDDMTILHTLKILKISPKVLRLAIKDLSPTEIQSLKLKFYSPEVIRRLLTKIDTADIDKLIIFVYDVGYQAREMKAEFQMAINSAKLSKYLQDKNWVMVRSLLEEAKVEESIIDQLMSKIGIDTPEVEMPFIERILGESALVIETFEEEIGYGDIVIFDISDSTNRIKALKFVDKNKDKIGAIIVGWDNEGMNNLDNLDISTYPELAKADEEFFTLAKGIKPDLPVGRVICITSTWKEYMEASIYEWNFIAIWNLYNTYANFERVKGWFPNQDILIAGMHARRGRGKNESLGLYQKYLENWKKAKFGDENYQNYIQEIKDLGYVGSIWIP